MQANESSRRYCLALDLHNDAELIAAYKKHHEADRVWPEITAHLRATGIEEMEIYHIGDRLFMIMEVNDSFSFERQASMDSSNPKIQEWEELMHRYQRSLPWGEKGEKWLHMENIFRLSDCV